MSCYCMGPALGRGGKEGGGFQRIESNKRNEEYEAKRGRRVGRGRRRRRRGEIGGLPRGEGEGIGQRLHVLLAHCLRSKSMYGGKAVIRTRSVNPLKSRRRGREVGVEAFEGESDFAA